VTCRLSPIPCFRNVRIVIRANSGLRSWPKDRQRFADAVPAPSWPLRKCSPSGRRWRKQTESSPFAAQVSPQPRVSAYNPPSQNTRPCRALTRTDLPRCRRMVEKARSNLARHAPSIFPNALPRLAVLCLPPTQSPSRETECRAFRSGRVHASEPGQGVYHYAECGWVKCASRTS
jgi:hypothetical protein